MNQWLPVSEAWFHQLFGRWAAREVAREQWDIVHCWSGVSAELLDALEESHALKLLMRGSSHIRTQARLLAEEQERTGASQDQPSAWMIAREEKEYTRADAIAVLSTFAYNTFIEEGVPPDKLGLRP